MKTLIVGTNRPLSKTRAVARVVESIYKELGEPLAVNDLAELPPEIFHPTSYAKKPATFEPFLRRVLDSKGLIVVTPEYNGGPPGVLKYFIDMLPFPESFERRPVCFVGLGAGIWGGLRPVEHLQQIFGYRNAYLYPERVFIKGVHEMLDKDGNFVNPEIRERLQNQARGFIQFVARF